MFQFDANVCIKRKVLYQYQAAYRYFEDNFQYNLKGNNIVIAILLFIHLLVNELTRLTY